MKGLGGSEVDHSAEYRASMITAGWAYRRGDISLARHNYGLAVISAANGVTRTNPTRKREMMRYRVAFNLMLQTEEREAQ
jgi:hypothetical protein